MSKLLQPTKQTEKSQIRQNINIFVGIHDISCKCDHPLKCIIKQIYHQEPNIQFDKKELQKWFTTNETTVAHGGEEEDITGEELDALFENIEKEDNAG